MLLRATNVSKARLINVWVVFETVRVEGPVSRSAISDLTGLSKQAASDLVDELLSQGFVREEKSTGKGVGKPPTPISVNPGGPCTLGFHVDFGRVSAVVMDLAGTVLHRDDRPLDELEPRRAAIAIAALTDEMLGASRIGRDRILGIGLATPGPFAVAGLSPPRLPGWDGLRLRQLLGETTGFHVSLANDGQCAATAEWRFGSVARRLTTFVYVYLGMGVGSGVMIHSAAFGGAAGNAGEFGHITVVPGGHPCSCGKGGCLEAYVSIDSALRFMAARGVSVQSMAAFERDFGPDHPAVAAWLRAATEPLRVGLNTIENLFDPQTIMVGGNGPAWVAEALLARVEPLYPSVGGVERDIPRLIRAELGSDAVARGAAALPVLSRLDPQYHRLNRFG